MTHIKSLITITFGGFVLACFFISYAVLSLVDYVLEFIGDVIEADMNKETS